MFGGVNFLASPPPPRIFPHISNKAQAKTSSTDLRARVMKYVSFRVKDRGKEGGKGGKRSPKGGSET